MKQLLLLATLVFSGASFAQDSVDLILTKAYGIGSEQPLEFARITVSRKIYDMTQANPKIELICKYSKDKDLQLGISQGQIYATHKVYFDGVVRYCNTTPSCRSKQFEDISSWVTMAGVSPMISGIRANNYSIESIESWIKRRDRYASGVNGVENWKYAELDNISHLEIYSPSKHGDRVPAVKGFGCFLWDHNLKDTIEP